MTATNWAAERRLDFIDWRRHTAGAVKRDDICQAFGITRVQATEDIRRYLEQHPGALTYDGTLKRYVSMTPNRRLRKLPSGRPVADLAAVLGWE